MPGLLSAFVRALSNKVPPGKMELVASFYAAGVAQVSALWIAKKLPLSTREMASTLSDLLKGLQRRHDIPG